MKCKMRNLGNLLTSFSYDYRKDLLKNGILLKGKQREKSWYFLNTKEVCYVKISIK